MGSRISILLASLLWTLPAFSQLPDFSTQWGYKQSLLRAPFGIEIVDIDDKSMYVVTSTLKGDNKLEVPRTIERYNKLSLERTDTLVLNSLIIEEAGKKCRIEQILTIDKKLYIIYSRKESRRLTLFSQELSKITLQNEGPVRKLCEIALDKKTKVRKGRFQFSFSKDRSKIFGFRGLSKDVRRGDLTSFIMLDTAFNLLWQKATVLPYLPGMLRPETVKVSNDGNVYALVNQKVGRQVNNVFNILLVQNKGDSILEYPLRVKNGFLTNMQIEILSNENLLCSGFYSRTGGASARGTYFIEFDTFRNNVKAVRNSEFDVKFILQDLNKRDMAWVQSRAERDMEAELNGFAVDNILIQKDSSVILVGEQRYRYEISAGDNYFRTPVYLPARPGQVRYNIRANNSSLHRNYHGDIVVVKLDKAGEILWTQKIHKSQDTSERNGIFSSYLLAVIHGKVCILFNDNPINLNEDRRTHPKDFGGGRKFIIVMVTLDEEGDQTREWIHDSINTNVTVSPILSKQVSDSELILFGHHWVYQQFTRVKFR